MKTTLLLLFTFITVLTTQAQLTGVKIIHNSADPAADNVSVWIITDTETTKVKDNFRFRSATSFNPFPAKPTKVAFAPAGSVNISDTIPGLTQSINLDPSSNHILMVVGNIGTGYKANPDGLDTKFRLLIIDNARIRANDNNKVEPIIVHGSTDAPTVDMVVDSLGTKLADDIKYGEFSSYTTLDNDAYRFLMQDKDNTTTLGAYAAPFSIGFFYGEAPVVFASGYLSPSENNNGKSLAWFASVAENVISVNDVTSVNELLKEIDSKLYPNPTTTNLNIEFELEKNSTAAIDIYDNTGRIVYTEKHGLVAGNNTIKINTGILKTGIYYYTLTTKKITSTKRFIITK